MFPVHEVYGHSLETPQHSLIVLNGGYEDVVDDVVEEEG